MGFLKYYDIGLNLFCKQFPDPEKIIRDAEENEVCCILTGTDTKENKKIKKWCYVLFPEMKCLYPVILNWILIGIL